MTQQLIRLVAHHTSQGFAWKKIGKGDIELEHIFGEDPLGDRCVHCVIKLWVMLQDKQRFLWTVDVSSLLAHRPSAQQA